MDPSDAWNGTSWDFQWLACAKSNEERFEVGSGWEIELWWKVKALEVFGLLVRVHVLESDGDCTFSADDEAIDRFDENVEPQEGRVDFWRR